ncbi:MAG TPA: hypothetical protein VE422_46750 [Terriglobia bacterium]|nr:hypothetical protein [Terriglobia bacterium]
MYSGSIIALRVLPTWLPIYAADIYLSKGLKLENAVIAAGLRSTLYLVGRLFGGPTIGFVRIVTAGGSICLSLWERPTRFARPVRVTGP